MNCKPWANIYRRKRKIFAVAQNVFRITRHGGNIRDDAGRSGHMCCLNVNHLSVKGTSCMKYASFFILINRSERIAALAALFAFVVGRCTMPGNQ